MKTTPTLLLPTLAIGALTIKTPETATKTEEPTTRTETSKTSKTSNGTGVSYAEFQQMVTKLDKTVRPSKYADFDQYVEALLKIGLSLEHPLAKNVVMTVLARAARSHHSNYSIMREQYEVVQMECNARSLYEPDYETMVQFTDVQGARASLHSITANYEIQRSQEGLLKAFYPDPDGTARDTV